MDYVPHSILTFDLLVVLEFFHQLDSKYHDESLHLIRLDHTKFHFAMSAVTGGIFVVALSVVALVHLVNDGFVPHYLHSATHTADDNGLLVPLGGVKYSTLVDFHHQSHHVLNKKE